MENGYFHFRLHPLLRTYFNFVVENEIFQCITLPFGMNWAPTVFTKCLRPVIAAIRSPRLIEVNADWLIK